MKLACNGEIKPAYLWSGQVLFISQLVVESFEKLCFKFMEVDSKSCPELIRLELLGLSFIEEL